MDLIRYNGTYAVHVSGNICFKHASYYASATLMDLCRLTHSLFDS